MMAMKAMTFAMSDGGVIKFNCGYIGQQKQGM